MPDGPPSVSSLPLPRSVSMDAPLYYSVAPAGVSACPPPAGVSACPPPAGVSARPPSAGVPPSTVRRGARRKNMYYTVRSPCRRKRMGTLTVPYTVSKWRANAVRGFCFAARLTPVPVL
jgi:hypothetical protein